MDFTITIFCIKASHNMIEKESSSTEPFAKKQTRPNIHCRNKFGEQVSVKAFDRIYVDGNY